MTQYKLIVDKSKQMIYVANKKGRILEKMLCSTGSGIERDGYSGITPNGIYSIRDIVDSKDLSWIGDPTGLRRPYSPWMFTLDYEPEGLAIHGTDEPRKLGLPVTHGCIRVSKDNVIKLKQKYVDIGTLVGVIDDN